MNIRANIRYLRVVLRHKRYVYREGRKLGLPRLDLLIHDMTKFSRSEWGPYVQRFATGRAGNEDKTLDPAPFKAAWRHHYTHNPHHWEFWLCDTWGVQEAGLWPKDIPILFVLEHHRHGVFPPNGALVMPERFVREMVADWQAASRAYSGKADCLDWYAKTKDRQVMHPDTRSLVEDLLGLA